MNNNNEKWEKVVETEECILAGYVSAKMSKECQNEVIEELDEEDPENASELILKNKKGE